MSRATTVARVSGAIVPEIGTARIYPNLGHISRDGSVLITWEQASRLIPWLMTAGSWHRVVGNDDRRDETETQ
jgi:hypothetical protein